jgi:3-hydroxyisobutyrate dehydrogenase
VAAANTLVTMLPSSPEVKKVYSEAGGILSGLRALPREDGHPTLCIDSTTLDVEIAKSVAEDVIVSGAEMVDAPVSGGMHLSHTPIRPIH